MAMTKINVYSDEAMSGRNNGIAICPDHVIKMGLQLSLMWQVIVAG